LDQKEKIIEQAVKLFMAYGVRSVTMDDVARELGMSKKTLYQSFSQKDELVTQCCQWHINREVLEFDEISRDAQNAIDEIHKLTSCVRRTMQNLNPSLLFDLQKYHPDGWQVFLDFKYHFIRKTVEENIKKGIAEGYYRPELHPEIIAKLRMQEVEMVFDPRVFPPAEYDLLEVQMAVMDHFVHGLLTPQGKALLIEYQQQQDVKE
jgi:AcrR family transcriptional regulator